MKELFTRSRVLTARGAAATVFLMVWSLALLWMTGTAVSAWDSVISGTVIASVAALVTYIQAKIYIR